MGLTRRLKIGVCDAGFRPPFLRDLGNCEENFLTEGGKAVHWNEIQSQEEVAEQAAGLARIGIGQAGSLSYGNYA